MPQGRCRGKRQGARHWYYPPGAKTVGNFVPAVTVGKVMYLAGNGPKMPNGKFVIGELGSGPGQLSVEQGYQASKFAAISMFSAIKGGTWRPQQGKAHCKSTRNGQLRSCVHRTAEGDQRRLRSFGAGFRRLRKARALGGGCFVIDFRHCGRDRDDSRASLRQIPQRWQAQTFRSAKAGDDAELKKWAARTLPHLKQHLTMAQKLK